MAKHVKMSKNEELKLGELMLMLMKQMGAVQTHSHPYDLNDEGIVTRYEFQTGTPLGSLKISFSVPDHCLYCRFDEVDRAAEVMRGAMNEFSGKYNEYAFDQATAEEAFEMFEQHLARIWVWSHVEPIWKRFQRDVNGKVLQYPDLRPV